MKVFGIGLTRTGTTSLTEGLKVLGYSAIHCPMSYKEIDSFEASTDTAVAARFEFLDLLYPESKFILTTIYLTLILLAFTTVDLCFGSINLFSLETTSPLFSTIFFDIRLPKTLTCIIAGSSLALCGLLMQSLFRNPLSGPYVLGVSSGSSLFVAIATMLISSIQVSGFYFMGKSIVTLFSIAGAFLVTLVILIISKKNKSNITILLVGLMLGQILGALQALIEYTSSADNLKTFVIWGMGSVGSTTLQDLFFVIPIYILAIRAKYPWIMLTHDA